jgi:hypothetical protein
MNEDTGSVAFMLLVVGFFAGLMIATLFSQAHYRTRIIDRGYGLYCPADGEFAFIGECKE